MRQIIAQILLQIFNLHQTSDSDRRKGRHGQIALEISAKGKANPMKQDQYLAIVIISFVLKWEICRYYATVKWHKLLQNYTFFFGKCNKLSPQSWEKLVWDAFVGAISGGATMKRDQYLVMVIISTIAHRSIPHNGPYFFGHKYDYGKGDD